LVLGLVLGYVVWQTGSILTGIVIHALNNGLMISVARSDWLQQLLGAEEATALPWMPTLVGCIVVSLALALVVLGRPRANTTP
jgi:sodium transport system permease protein